MADLKIGGVSCRKLADACGTPLYVYDEAELEKQLRDSKVYFRSSGFETEVVYASKAFACKAMFEKVMHAGLGLDVVSGGELYLAHKSNFPMDRIYFHGNNKTEEELRLAFDLGCKTVVIDNVCEGQKVIELSKRLGKNIDALIRVNLGIDAHTHEYIMTAHADSKFGISSEKRKEIAEIIGEIRASKTVTFKGFHSHIGSQISGTEAFEMGISMISKFARNMQDEYGIKISVLSIGGGFGIRYVEGDTRVPEKKLYETLIKRCEDCFEHEGIEIERVLIEPGRYITGEAGYTLYTVGYQKQTPSKKYLFVDGGMSENIRPALYGAKYKCDITDKVGETKTETYCIAGKNCESGDILIHEAKLPEAQGGDLLVMYSTGAYGYSMAGNYNRMGRPAVVFAKDGKARLVLRRESYEDQMKTETNEDVRFLNCKREDEKL